MAKAATKAKAKAAPKGKGGAKAKPKAAPKGKGGAKAKPKAAPKGKGKPKGVGIRVVDDRPEPTNQAVAVIHVFADAGTWKVARTDHTVLHEGKDEAAAMEWVCDTQAEGTSVVREAPTGWKGTQEPAQAAAAGQVAADPSDAQERGTTDSGGTVANPEVRQLAAELANAEAIRHGFRLKMLGKPVRSLVQAITVAIGNQPLFTGIGKPGSVVVCGEGGEFQAAILEPITQEPEPAKAASGRGGAPRQAFEGQSMTAVLRFLGGARGIDAPRAAKVCGHLGLNPDKATVSIQVRAGKMGTRGGVPSFPPEIVAKIDAAIAATEGGEGAAAGGAPEARKEPNAAQDAAPTGK